MAVPSESRAATSLKTQANEIIVGVALVGVAIGVGVFYAIHESGRHVHGCAISATGGLELRQKDDPQVWLLIGDTASIKPGDRVKVAGKKQKKMGTAPRTFIVEKAKDYGPCS
jgi:hypothetical protein